uniref:Putative secreted peptide n=1 Tax=Anopheles braziliensis TaxID=58242 RepID=A0A2M3ZWY3_9DIPT
MREIYMIKLYAFGVIQFVASASALQARSVGTITIPMDSFTTMATVYKRLDGLLTLVIGMAASQPSRPPFATIIT